MSIDTHPPFSKPSSLNGHTINNFDEMLCKELNELSFKDRTVIQEELHCVKVPKVAETPEFLGTSLEQLKKEINAVPLEKKKAYEDALVADSKYVQSKAFQLKFLRAEKFNVQKAAVRLIRCLELLFQYYGPTALQRPLLFSDLTKKELEHLRTGCFQILPSRDRAVSLRCNYSCVKELVGDQLLTPNISFLQGRLIMFIHSMTEDGNEETAKTLVCLLY